MKALVIGLGSMGRKRVPILRQFGVEVFGADPRPDRRRYMEDTYGIKTWESFEKGLDCRPDMLFVCNTPTDHMRYVRFALLNNIHSFAEDNVVNSPDAMDEVIALSERKPEIVAAPSCTMRFHPCIQIIRREMERERLGPAGSGFITYQCGAYLPDWHPYEGVEDYYVGRRETGGGCDMVTFEYDWLQWIYGRVTGVSCTARKFGGFKADIFDTYQLLSEFESGAAAAATVDVLTRWSSRYFRFSSEKGELYWDYNRHFIDVYDADDNRWEHIPEAPITGAYKGWDQMQMYRDEVRHFLDAVEGKTRFCTDYRHDLRNNLVMLACEESHRKGIRVTL